MAALTEPQCVANVTARRVRAHQPLQQPQAATARAMLPVRPMAGNSRMVSASGHARVVAGGAGDDAELEEGDDGAKG